MHTNLCQLYWVCYVNGRWVETPRGSQNGVNVGCYTRSLRTPHNADCMYHYIDLIIIIWSVLDFSWKGCEDILFYVCLLPV